MSTRVDYTDRVDYHRRSIIGQLSRDVIMTKASNPEVLAICYNRGWSASPNYMTKQEAEAVTDTSGAFKSSNIKSFDEFKYFTGITVLEQQAFYYCRYLSSITIPSSIVSGGSGAFSRCEQLRTITWNSSLMPYIGVTSESYASEFKTENPNLSTVNGCLYSANKTILYGVPSQHTSYSWLGSEIAIGDMAFRNSCINTSIVFPQTVTSIGVTPFYEVKYILSLDLSNTPITDITNTVVRPGADSLFSQLILPRNLERITAPLFNSSGSMTTLTIPASVTYISSNMTYLSMVNTLIFESTDPSAVKKKIVRGSLSSILVPASSVDTYKESAAFDDVVDLIQAIPSN